MTGLELHRDLVASGTAIPTVSITAYPDDRTRGRARSATSATTESSALLHLLQVANGSFPLGSFSHSYGLETLIQDGRIIDAEDLADVACLSLRYGVAMNRACDHTGAEVQQRTL